MKILPNNLPFPTGDNSPRKVSHTFDLVAANAEILTRASNYRKELPDAMRNKVIHVREYFLMDVLPLLAAIETGMADATEVVRHALDDEPSSDSFETLLTGAVIEALVIKLLTFVIKYVGLNQDQAALFVMTYMSKTLKGADNGRIAETVLRKMSEVLDLQGSKQNNNQVQLRPVQEAKGNTRRKRTDGGEPNRPARRGRGASKKP